MNYELLKLIQMTRERFKEDRIRFPKMKKNPLSVVRYVANVPLLRTNKEFVFDSIGSPGSKSHKVFNEIPEVLGCEKTQFKVLNEKSPLLYFIRLSRVISRVPCILTVYYKLKKKKYLDDDDIAVILGFIFFKRFFDRNPNVKPIVYSDVNPSLCILCAASNKNGYIWWQEDFHHNQVPPFKPVVLILLTDTAKNNILKAGIRGNILMQNQRKFIQIENELAQKELRVTFSVNGFFSANKKEIEVIEKIMDTLNVKSVSIRLHPTSKLDQSVFPSFITVLPASQSIESYACEWDLFIVGNSAIQLKILLLGKHVLHVPGLDTKGYDLYEYCKNNVVIGTENFDENLVEEINKFYKNTNYLENASKLL